MNIQIDEEFKSHLPAPRPEERANLESLLIEEGCREPLITWNGVLVDGHNRYEICTRNNIEYSILEKTFESRDDVIAWIEKTQSARRNVKDDWWNYYLGRDYQRSRRQGARTDLTSAHCEQKLTSAESLAKDKGVGQATVRRAATFSEAVDALAETLGNDYRNKVLDGDVKVTQGEVIALSRKEPEQQKSLIEKIETGAARNLSEAVRQERRELAQGLDTSEAPAQVEYSIEHGQWWQLGRHLLYCGDTSQPHFYEGIPTADLAFADPPYNAGVADWDNSFEWQHDWLMERAEVVAVTPGIASIMQFARVTKMPYRWAAACWIANGMTRGELGFGNWIPIFLFANDSLHCNSQDFLKVTINISETGETSHKGRKPSELLLWLIETFTERGQLVVDPFLGSGTTLFAAELSGRVCIGGELSPDYCRDIIARFEKITGLKAERSK